MFHQLDRISCGGLQSLGRFACWGNQCHSWFDWVLLCCLLFFRESLQYPLLFRWCLVLLLRWLYSAFPCLRLELIHPLPLRIICWGFLSWKWHYFYFKKCHLIFLKFYPYCSEAVFLVVLLFRVMLSGWW